jgi:DNA-binding MurR/RpiR family transcriptional regulator
MGRPKKITTEISNDIDTLSLKDSTPTNFQILRMIACSERELFSSADSLAEALDVWRATVLSRLHNSLGMKNFHPHWPHAS